VTLGARLLAHGLVLPPGHSLASVADEPELRQPLGEFNGAVWPEFMLNDEVANTLWVHLFSDFAEFQCGLFNADGDLVAGLNSAPLAWDGTDAGLPHGWDDQFRRSVDDVATGRPPDTLGALQIVVGPDRQGSGYSARMLASMRANARLHGFRAVIACVRPNRKAEHPLEPIEAYARRTRADGLPEDPWLRVHVRAGGRIVRAVPDSMTVEGTIAEWREWTGLELPTSGPYLPEGAASPVDIDLGADRGVYHDPNVWVVHHLD
jgi:GNAT superfamily N-acetyltransferase